ncbi:hypothetical protein [Akkermansia sp.]|uniref:hypothetical protein n=1 Tax=Akkermansia sp. TaxID=1872421 RepID=UPI003AB762D5
MTPGFHWTLRPSVKEDDPALKAFPAELPLLVKQLLLQRGFKGGADSREARKRNCFWNPGSPT